MADAVKPSVKCGAALVEMAITLPLLCLLTFGLIEYSWLFLKTHQVSDAARQGARLATLPDSTDLDVENRVKSVMNTAGLGASGYKYTLTSATHVGDPVSVDIDVEYAKIALLKIPLVPMSKDLHIHAFVCMAKEGP
jgi:Flp pilus assembly protein TadG